MWSTLDTMGTIDTTVIDNFGRNQSVRLVVPKRGLLKWVPPQMKCEEPVSRGHKWEMESWKIPENHWKNIEKVAEKGQEEWSANETEAG